MQREPFRQEKFSRTWGRGLAELRREVTRLGKLGHVFDGLLYHGSLCMFIGDSGLGKSPLLYQAGLCAAAGMPFLGMKSRPSNVLMIDLENGAQGQLSLLENLCEFLGINFPEGHFRIAGHECADEVSLQQAIQDCKPDIVIVDPLNAVFPGLERDNETANYALRRLRSLISANDVGTMICVHHIRKHDWKLIKEEPRLENEAQVRDWFEFVRGPRVLVNGADVRLGLDRTKKHAKHTEIVFRGFARLSGLTPALWLRRFCKLGEPQGYVSAGPPGPEEPSSHPGTGALDFLGLTS